tara:strand:- start:241 stop:624 length:384 start_codon:yes stop_codon:yes gene_type:complete
MAEELEWAPGVTAIEYVTDLGTTPASVNRRTGTIYINLRIWKRLPPSHRFFVLLHEMGHIVLKTKDEKAVDDWAFKEYAARGYSLKESVKALTRLLSFAGREHTERANLQLARAKAFDRRVNKNFSV